MRRTFITSLFLVNTVFLLISCQLQETAAPSLVSTLLPASSATSLSAATATITATPIPLPTVTLPVPLPFAGTLPSGVEARFGVGQLGSPVLSPDGNYLAVAGGVGIILYRPETLTEIGILPQADYVGAIAWAPDSKRLAAVSSLENVTIWDVENARPIQTLAASDVSCLAWSPDGTKLALANGDKIVEIWSLNPTRRMHSFAKHAVTPAGWGAMELQWTDENTIISLDEYSQLLLWETDTGKVIRTWSRKKNDPSRRIALSPDRKTLAITSMQSQKVLLWDLVTQQERKTIDLPRYILGMAWSPDGNSIALETQFPSKIVFVDVSSGAVRKEFPSNAYGVGGLLWLKNGQEVITISGPGDGNSLTVWDIETGQGIYGIRGWGANLVAWSADGKTIAASDGKAIVLWDVQTRTPRVLPGEIRNDASAGAPNYINVFRIAFNPSGHLLAAELGDDSSYIRIWNTATGQLVKEIGAGEHLTELYWTSDTQLIARTVWNNNVWIWEAGNWENFQTINLDAFEAEHLDISADGKRVALIRDDTLEIRELTSGKKLYSWKVDWEPKMDLAWSPDGTRIVMVDTEKFTVYEAGTGKKLNSLNFHVSQFGGLKWSPDSSSIAYLIKVPESASALRRGRLANEIYLWHIASTDARLVTRTQISAYLLSKDNFCFSPDSKSLALALWQKGLIVLRLQ